MAIRSTKGLKIYLENDNATPVVKDGSDGGTTLTGIAANATAATHIDLTVDAVSGITAGDIVTFKDTGFTELDGKSFVVVKAAGTAIEVNADITGTAGTFDPAKAVATFLTQGDMTNICASSVSVDANVPGTVSVATFCNPTASIPSVVSEAGNLTLNVYHDPSDSGFKLLAKLAELGNQTQLKIVFPGGQGYLLAKGTISSFQISDLPLDGSAAWSATLALAGKPHFVA